MIMEPIRPDQPDELHQLRAFRMKAPESALPRFRLRARLMQGGRMLMESQVTGFWLVLDTVLRRLLGPMPTAVRAITKDPAFDQSGTGERS